MKDYLTIAAVVLGLAAALFGVVAAQVHVRNQIDHFMDDIHKQSSRASIAAILAAASATAQAVATLFAG